jgi:hypothetical protein
VHRKLDGWLCELTLDEGARTDSPHRFRSQSGRRASDEGLLPISLEHYLQLLDWTGRQLRRGKRGAIPAHLAPILERLAIREGFWLDVVEHLDEWFGPLLARPRKMVEAAARMGHRWLKGNPASRRAFR